MDIFKENDLVIRMRKILSVSLNRSETKVLIGKAGYMCMDWSRESTPVSLRKIIVHDGFWKQKMELVRKEVLPYQWNALNDKIPGAAPSFCMRNFKLAGKITAERSRQKLPKERIWPVNRFETLPEKGDKLEDRFYGFVFQDSDFYKWIEAVAYSLTQSPDPELERIADAAIEVVCAAQQTNGYLDTYYIINDRSKIFTDLRSCHELYCFGHLAEGAVAYYEATGKETLLNAAMKYADYICECIGSEEGKKKGYPGHEIAEMALVRLYGVTGEQKYLKLGKYFIDERGKKPFYFEQEHPEDKKSKKEAEDRMRYCQAHMPVREQKEAVGHAVRAVYLYSGMADIARITKDDSLFNACRKLWDNITRKKMYITGGIGATSVGEAFSYNYDLPNDTAYAETCASIGLVFFARRMLEIQPKREYADVMERALYNGILSGMSLDGKSFFYVNPLEVFPEACEKDQRKEHVRPVRQKWFGCACCPPNIARLTSSIASYAYTESQLDNITYVHLYLESSIKKNIQGQEAMITILSEFPWDGKVVMRFASDVPVIHTIAFRIPEWCGSYTVNAVPGILKGRKKSEQSVMEVRDGYLYVTKEWKTSDDMVLNFDMNIRLMQADPMVREDIGKVVVTRGPIVYCLEEADNGENLHELYIEKHEERFAYKSGEFGTGNQVMCIRASGKRAVHQPEKVDHPLYYEIQEEEYEEVELKFIPYYTWANKGAGEMMVWVRVSN